MMSLLLAAAIAAAPPAPSNAPPSIDLRSETLTVEHGKRRAVFGGGVEATRGDLVLRCPEVIATYGEDSQVREVACQGPVDATQGARKMSARSGIFDNATGLLTLEGEPMLTEGARRLEGETLVYDANTQSARLTNVRGEIPAAEAPDLPGTSGPLHVEAATVVHDLANQRTVFDGGIKATRGNLVLRAPRLTAHYDEAGDLQRAVTSGGDVRVVQGERRGQAKVATFTGGARTLVLTGEPKITEGASTLTGTKATFLLGQDRVVVDKPRATFPVGVVGGGK